jgi:hypothetical protein
MQALQDRQSLARVRATIGAGAIVGVRFITLGASHLS